MQLLSVFEGNFSTAFRSVDAFPYVARTLALPIRALRKTRTSKCSLIASILAYGFICYIFSLSFAKFATGYFSVSKQLRATPTGISYTAPKMGIAILVNNQPFYNDTLYRVFFTQITIRDQDRLPRVREPLETVTCTLGPQGIEGRCPSAQPRVQADFTDPTYQYQEMSIRSCLAFAPQNCDASAISKLAYMVDVDLFYYHEVAKGEFKWGAVYVTFDPSFYQGIETYFRYTRQITDSRWYFDTPPVQEYVAMETFYIRRAYLSGNGNLIRFFIRASPEFYEERIIYHSILLVSRETGAFWVVVMFVFGAPSVLANYLLFLRDRRRGLKGTDPPGPYQPPDVSMKASRRRVAALAEGSSERGSEREQSSEASLLAPRAERPPSELLALHRRSLRGTVALYPVEEALPAPTAPPPSGASPKGELFERRPSQAARPPARLPDRERNLSVVSASMRASPTPASFSGDETSAWHPPPPGATGPTPPPGEPGASPHAPRVSARASRLEIKYYSEAEVREPSKA
eukprot:tig00000025_g7911.t1